MNVPGLKWFLKTSPPKKLQNDISQFSGRRIYLRFQQLWCPINTNGPLLRTTFPVRLSDLQNKTRALESKLTFTVFSHC